MTGIALIWDNQGPFGHLITDALWNAGWHLRFCAGRESNLQAAARGVDVVVMGWDPRDPHRAQDVIILTRQVIAAARQTDAHLLLCYVIDGWVTPAIEDEPAQMYRASEVPAPITAMTGAGQPRPNHGATPPQPSSRAPAT